MVGGPKVAILGAGSVGCFIGGAWAAAGVPVMFIGRPKLSRDVDEYGLTLTDFSGWEARLSSFGRFGQLDVYLIDPYDVFVGKLFSARRKDRDDLRALATRLDKQTAANRLGTSANALLAEPRLAEQARENWYIVYGETLPA